MGNFKQRIIEEMAGRLRYLKREKKRATSDIKSKRKIHPAVKQLGGRILELTRIRKWVEKNG